MKRCLLGEALRSKNPRNLLPGRAGKESRMAGARELRETVYAVSVCMADEVQPGSGRPRMNSRSSERTICPAVRPRR